MGDISNYNRSSLPASNPYESFATTKESTKQTAEAESHLPTEDATPNEHKALVQKGVVITSTNQNPKEAPKLNDLMDAPIPNDPNGNTLQTLIEKGVEGTQSEDVQLGLNQIAQNSTASPQTTTPLQPSTAPPAPPKAKGQGQIFEYQQKGIQLEAKRAELALLQEAKNDPLANQQETQSKISLLQTQIATLEDQRTLLAVNMAKGTIDTAVSITQKGVDFGLNFLPAASTAAHVLHAVGQGAGGAGSLIGLVSSTANLALEANKADRVLAKLDELQQKLEATPLGSIEHEILKAKISQLKQQSTSLDVNVCRNAVGVFTSTAGTVAMGGSIALASGAAIGAAGAVAFTATGIGAGVVAGVVTIAATAYAVHQNKDAIANTFERAQISMETPVQNMRTGFVNSSIEDTKETIRQSAQVVSQESIRKTQVKKYVDGMVDKVNQLVQEKAVLSTRLHDLEETGAKSFFESLTTKPKIYSLKSQISSLDKDIQATRKNIQKILSSEEKRISENEADMVQRGKDLGEQLMKREELKEKVGTLQTRTTELQEEQKYIEMAKNMEGMNWQDVKTLHTNLTESLVGIPSAKEEARVFLQSQGHPLIGFDTDPAGTILAYVTQEVA